MKVAIGQVAPVVGDLQANLDRTRELTTQAVAEGAKLVVFPELNLSGYFTPPQLALAATDQRLRAATVGTGDASVLLGFPELDNGATCSSAALFIAGELLRHVHRKLISPSHRRSPKAVTSAPANALRAFNASRTAPTACDPGSAPKLLRAPSYRSHKGTLRGNNAGQQARRWSSVPQDPLAVSYTHLTLPTIYSV